MPDSPAKAPVTCPHCGHVQQEYASVISTYCRGCGRYYEKGARRPAPKPAARKPLHGPPRGVHCHRCDTDHEVSPSALTTICPGCSGSIELVDLSFSTNVSRPVDTRGTLTVTEKGYLTNSHIICREAFVEGRISGTLLSETAIHLSSRGAINCHLKARTLIIEKGARVELAVPAKIPEIIVHGHAFGQFECHRLQVSRHAVLEGRVMTRAMVVEPGGSLLAETSIQSAPRAAENSR